MERTYSRRLTRRLGLGLGGAATLAAALAAAFTLALPAAGPAISLFNGQPLDGSRFAILGRPVGAGDWNLLVLEQLQTRPLCWQERPDGLIDPALNRFDFTGICSRYLDSNGYSLRVGEEDLASRYRLRLEQRGTTLALLAMSPSQPVELLVGRGSVPVRDRDGFVAIRLEPGWQLQRRLYGQQALTHIYFANVTPLAELLARAEASTPRPGLKPAANPSSTLSATGSPPRTLPSAATTPRTETMPRGTGMPAIGNGNGPVALQVIPFQP